MMVSGTMLFSCLVFLGTWKMGVVSGQSKYSVDSISDYLERPDMSIIPTTRTIPFYGCTDSHRPKFGDVTMYQVYHDGRWWTQACPDSLEWNQNKCRCGYSDGSEPIAACRDYRQHSEGVGGKYEQFVNGKWIVRDCSLSVAGLVWDQTACQCVWGPGSSGKVTGQQITPCDVMLNMTFEDGVKDNAKGSFVEVGRGIPVSIEAIDLKGKSGNMAAHFTNTALNLWFFSNNELGSSLRLELTFKMEEDPSSYNSYQMLVSNGCNVSTPGYTTPSVAIGYRPSDQSYLLAFETVTARKAIVCSQKLGRYDWHTISLIYEDGTLLLRVDGHPCIISRDFSGHVQKTSCPLTIGADPLERESMYQGYIDDIIIARYCRRYVDKDDIDSSESIVYGSNPATHNDEGPMLVEAASGVSSGGGHWARNSYTQAGHRTRKPQVQKRPQKVEYVDEESEPDKNMGDMDGEESDNISEEYDGFEENRESKKDKYGDDKDYYDGGDESDENWDEEFEDGGEESGSVEFQERRNNKVKGVYVDVDNEREESSEKGDFDQRVKFRGREGIMAAWRKPGDGRKWWEQNDEEDEEDYDNNESEGKWGGLKGKDTRPDESESTELDKEYNSMEESKERDSWDTSSRWEKRPADQRGKVTARWPKQTKDETGSRHDYRRRRINSHKEDTSKDDSMFKELSTKAKSTDEKEFTKDYYQEWDNKGQEYDDMDSMNYDYDYSSNNEQKDSSDNSDRAEWKDEYKSMKSDYHYQDQSDRRSVKDYPDTTPAMKRFQDADKWTGSDEGVDDNDYSGMMDDNRDDRGWRNPDGQRKENNEDPGDHTRPGQADSEPSKADLADERHRELAQEHDMKHRDWEKVNGEDKVRRWMHDRSGKRMRVDNGGSGNVRMPVTRRMQRRNDDDDDDDFENGSMGPEGTNIRGKESRPSDVHDSRRLGDRGSRRQRQGHFTNRMGHVSRSRQSSIRHPMEFERKDSSKGDRVRPIRRPYDGKHFEREHRGHQSSGPDRRGRNRLGPGDHREVVKRWSQLQNRINGWM